MSHNRGTEDMDGERPPKGLSPEALQQYLAALAEDRDASVERTEGIVARFFKVAIVMVCLNVVIAGANVAMILTKPRTVAVAAPTPAPSVPAPTVPAPPAPAPIAAEAPSPDLPVLATPMVAAQPTPSIEAPGYPTAVKPAASPKPAVAPKPAVGPQPEKKVPLLGPLPVSRPAPAGAPMLARRPAKPVGRVMLNKPFLTDEYEEQDDDRPLGPPERW